MQGFNCLATCRASDAATLLKAPRAARHRLRAILSLSLLLTAAHSDSVFAGPPFITDDPDPVDYRAWEINYGATYLRTGGVSTGSLPSVDINYGFLPGVQLHIQPQMAYVRGPSYNAAGIGDTEVGVKYRLTAATEDKSKWMLAIYPMLELPTGNSGRSLGAGSHSLFLPLWAQTTRGKWTIFGGGGFRRVRAPDARNSRAGGVTVLYQVSERLQLGGEVFGETRITNDGRSSSTVNLGGVFNFAPRLSLLFSTGHGVRKASTLNQGSAYLGLRTEY